MEEYGEIAKRYDMKLNTVKSSLFRTRAKLREYLESGNWDLETLLSSAELRKGLLERLFPECLDVLQSGSTTGIFLTLTGPEPAEDFDGFFIRDSDPNTNPPDYTDLLLERGSKELSRAWNIPLDTNWTTRFHMGGREGNEAARYFYEPWRAGEEFPDADTEDLGYWAPPFCLEQDRTDTHEMITYSLPLRYEGRTYGVLGVEIDEDGASEIARRSRGTPRLANRLLKRVRDFAQVKYHGAITKEVADFALDILDVDKVGLDHNDRSILLTIIEKFDGGPVGLDTLAAALGEDAGTLEDVYEPYLLMNGFLNRTPRGRMATRHAYRHLDLPYIG